MNSRLQYDGPVVLAVLDGVGLSSDSAGNAVSRARTPFLGSAARNYFHVGLDASGAAVGLAAGQMGNSEVGHNALGSGQIISHGARYIDEAFASGEVYNSEAWHGAISRAKSGATLHFSGIFSDGGVHSNVKHLGAMIEQAYKEGVRKIRVHAIFDGRDVAPQSEPKYIRNFEEYVARFNDADIKIASGAGRMVAVSDRYENDWGMVEKGFKMMRDGLAGLYSRSAAEAVLELRRENSEIQDQNLPPFVVVDENGAPVGKIKNGDALIYFDFRADRAIEIAQAFTYWDFPYFNRGNYTPDDVYFVGLTEYNSDTHVPEHRLVEPLKIKDTLNKVLAGEGISQFACSETVKFGHITYYFNGNSYEKAPREEFCEIKSYAGAFEDRPWMKSAEITDKIIAELPNYKFLRLNFPGGDMVGHTADLEATMDAIEAIDLSLRRIAKEVDRLGGALVIVSDHGNAEEILTKGGAKKTSHTTNPVPFIIYDNTKNRDQYVFSGVLRPGLANVAATVATLLGVSSMPSSWERTLINLK